MDAAFWHDRWSTNQIGFHQSAVNDMLETYLDKLSLAPGSRIFLPLCGKTLDIAWLLSQGFRVAGAELSEFAVGQLFEQLGIEPQIRESGPLKHYSAPGSDMSGLDIFVGDIFDLTPQALGPVDAVYDRAALIALPHAMRQRYTRHLPALTGHAPQLLITLTYDQSRMDGPPFSISSEEVARHYHNDFIISRLLSRDIEGGLKGYCAASEAIWALKAKA